MLTLAPSVVEAVVGGLLRGVDVDEGPTSEQVLVLEALATHLWGRPDLDVRSVTRLKASEVASVLAGEDVRAVFHELHLTLEACRHPQSPAQVAAVQEYAEILGVDSEDLKIFRDLVQGGVEMAKRDYQRFLSNNMRQRSEPGLSDPNLSRPFREAQLSDLFGTLAEYGPGTLGRAYLSFYERFGLSLPGTESSSNDSFFVAHDMTHTIAGLSTTPEAELALSAFQFGMNNNVVNRAALLASLVVHEAGFAVPSHLKRSESGLLARPAAAKLFANELSRGNQCRSDFSLVDHFALAHHPISEVRAEFGVLPPNIQSDRHHWW